VSSARRTTKLMAELATTSFSAVGRKYGVSDNAIRKWVRAYERERASDRLQVHECEPADASGRAPPLAA
jgi:transposase-like protein